MADSKISALPASTTPLAGTEVLPIVQSSTTKQVSVANLTAGRTFEALGVTLTSTDAGATAAPLLDLYRDSATPAASDTLGEIEFNGEDSAGNKQAYGLIHASILSPTSTAEQGQLHFETATAGALTEKMIIGTSNLVINEIGAVFNVRIEGDTDANLFYTDATNSRVGIGTISPASKLDVVGTVGISSTTTLSGLTASTALALNASKEIVSVTNTGTGNNVLATSPTLSGTAALASLSFTGQMNAAFGSVGAPSIFFNTDTTSGFYRSSSATVGIAAGGVAAASFGATSASVVGALTGGSGYQVSGFSVYRASGVAVSSPGDAALYFNSGTGYTLQARAGSSYDWSLINPGNANYIARNPTGTLNIEFLGGVAITGALSKGSGSFRIQHPLPEKKQTHDLVHSFIEGPKADLIYRGLVKLQDGLAQVNIDEVSGMTAGTFVALCREVQCFTSNETGWTALRGKVVGNVLSIESQQPCNDEVSWMVIGERQDEHMINTDWTDDQGRVIVEPEKRLASDSSVPQEIA